ncbi:MAG TPA: lysophospholipid acyltransferase family protein [Polyangiaceae bacterium]
MTLRERLVRALWRGVSGLAPPEGHRPPPPPPWSARVRTARIAGILAPRFAFELLSDRLRPVGSTTTEEGLAAVRTFSLDTLRRLRVELEIVGAERVPREGGVLFMWKQESHLDHLLLGAAIPRPFASLYNNAVAAAPLYGEWFRRSGHFHVDRSDEAQWRRSIARAAEALRGGRCILVSPEGTRSWDGKLLPMKRGAFMLARQAERPIVCVTLAGAHACLPRGSATVRPGKVTCVLSFPIPVRADDTTLEARVVETFEAASQTH